MITVPRTRVIPSAILALVFVIDSETFRKAQDKGAKVAKKAGE